jgi:hypothetical protein
MVTEASFTPAKRRQVAHGMNRSNMLRFGFSDLGHGPRWLPEIWEERFFLRQRKLLPHVQIAAATIDQILKKDPHYA